MDIDDVTRALELDIVFGRIRPRERLVEDELMERIGAKRHQVRAALAQLEQLGIVERRMNRGAIVRDFSVEEVEDLYEMRDHLHLLAVAKMDLPFSRTRVDRLRAIQARHDAAILGARLENVLDSNNAFHDELFDGCGNRYLAEAIRRHAWLSHAIRSYRIADREMLEQARKEHGEMIEVGAIGDRAALAELCTRHIQPSKLAYLDSRVGSDPAFRAS
ncbi:MAG: GntR family transcriptional regulator [Trueperaceae bacterium]|nr:GntR family transcriptional regulator [Trueperaceae bacterium]